MAETTSELDLVPTFPVRTLPRFGWYFVGRSPGEAFGYAQRARGTNMLRIPGVPQRLTGRFNVPQDAVIVADPTVATELALNKSKTFSSEPAWNILRVGGMFRRGLLQMEFDEHRFDRLVIQQSLTPAKLGEYSERIEPSIRQAVRDCEVGDKVDLRGLFKRTAMAVALNVFVDLPLSQSEIDKIGKCFDDLVHPNLARQAMSRRYLLRAIESWIPRKRIAKTPDLLSQLCHATRYDGEPFTDRQIVDHMMFFLFAAHDTSTITMTNMAYYIGLNRKWQAKARQQSLAGDEVLNFKSIGELTVLDMIMKETLRFRTPVPILNRWAMEDTELAGYRIRKGTFVSAVTWLHHTNPDIWSDPDRFDPERFAKERAEDKANKGQWMPFGGGAHKCIGMYFARMEIFTLFHNLLREFEWEVDPNYVLPTMQNSLAFSNGFPARVTRRAPDAPAESPDDYSDVQIRWGMAPNVLPRRRTTPPLTATRV